jgi:hypothetical protein
LASIYYHSIAIYSGLLALFERLHRLHAGVGGQHLFDLDDLRDAVNHLLAELHLGEACTLSTFSRKLQLASISIKKKKDTSVSTVCGLRVSKIKMLVNCLWLMRLVEGSSNNSSKNQRVSPMRCLFEMSHFAPTAAECSPDDPRGCRSKASHTCTTRNRVRALSKASRGARRQATRSLQVQGVQGVQGVSGV